jgi:DNA-binding response OmpR family regulator
VLLVDDEPLLLRTTQRLLEYRGFAVLAASDAAGALEILRAGMPIDLLMTDVILRKSAGSELASRARRIRPGLKVLFVSGLDSESLRLTLGTDPLLEKPFTARDLDMGLAAVLGARPGPSDSSSVTPRDLLG